MIRDQPAIQWKEAKDAIQPKRLKRMLSRCETFRLSASRAMCVYVEEGEKVTRTSQGADGKGVFDLLVQ